MAKRFPYFSISCMALWTLRSVVVSLEMFGMRLAKHWSNKCPWRMHIWQPNEKVFSLWQGLESFNKIRAYMARCRPSLLEGACTSCCSQTTSTGWAGCTLLSINLMPWNALKGLRHRWRNNQAAALKHYVQNRVASSYLMSLVATVKRTRYAENSQLLTH